MLSNHDKSRIGTRIGAPQARVAAMLLLTLRGTPTIYYGEEIGMVDTPIPQDRIEDPSEKRQPGLGLGRDPERTPMPWDSSPNGGFTTGRPWLPLGDHATINVASEARDPGSMLALYRRLIALRRAHPALVGGSIAAITWSDGMVAYERRLGATCVKVVLNLTAVPRSIEGIGGRVLLSTTLERNGEIVSGKLGLGANEGLVVALEAWPVTSPQKQRRLP